jgi:nicotinate-nucleotide adenylyltransferase
MHLGIFGGSFDPVHHGHLAAARACRDQVPLDEVWFLPTANQPLKPNGPVATGEQRVEMLHLAIGDDSRFRVCSLELERGGVSYSVDTVRQLHAELPGADLYFILGADILADISHWKEPAEVFRLATPLVVTRAGEPPPDLSALQAFCDRTRPPRRINMPPHEISSSDLRQRIASGESIDELVPPAVARYVREQRLYLANE